MILVVVGRLGCGVASSLLGFNVRGIVVDGIDIMEIQKECEKNCSDALRYIHVEIIVLLQTVVTMPFPGLLLYFCEKCVRCMKVVVERVVPL